ncbi:MAG: hypothetical protein IPP49_02010 [Saprospiraceae bacterium]|nr:hypothetical protein [Saprospiraceae bacterium]
MHKNGYDGVLLLLTFSGGNRKKIIALGDGTQRAPAQSVEDLVYGRLSQSSFYLVRTS